MRPSRRTTAFTKIWSYFRSEVSLNLGSQVNVRNASNDVRNASTTSQIAYLFDGKSTRFYKPKSYLPSTYNTPSIPPLQNRQLQFDSCFVQIPTPSAIFLADLPRWIPRPTVRLQRQRAPHYLQSRHRLLPSLQICQVGNHVNSAPTTPARFLSSTPSNLPASATIITPLEELRPAKYTYIRPFIIALTYLKKYEKDINLKI